MSNGTEGFGMGDYGMRWNNDGIMSMRWESKDLMQQLWRNLAYVDYQTINGQVVLQQNSGLGKPPLNMTGAKAVINMIQSVVNPVVSLSKIHQDQALTLVRHITYTIMRMLVINANEYGCDSRVEKEMVIQIVKNVVFAQLMRPVNGHESTHSRINLVERREEGSYTSSSKGAFKLPWDKKGE